MKQFLLLITTLLFFITVALAQEEEEEPVKNSFKGTRFVNGQSVNLVKKGELHLQIQHRFGDISGGAYELFGLDEASMRLGFEYGFGNNFNLGIGRSSWLKTFDAFAKYRLAGQSSSFPFSVVITVGGSLPTRRDIFPDAYDNFSDKFSWDAELLLAKTMGRIGIQVSPGYLKTGYINQISKNLSLFTLGLGGAVSISKKVSANVEYLLPFNSDIPGKNALSLGVDIDTGGHLFQLVLSNNQRMFHQAVYTDTAGDWTEGKLYFGFNLIREFKLKYY